MHRTRRHAVGTTGAVIIQYPLIIILGDLILYRDKMIYFKTRLVKLEVEGRYIVVSFNVLLLGKNKAVLGMLFL